MPKGRRELAIDYHALHARYISGEPAAALAEEAGITFAGLYRAWHRKGLPVRGFRDAALLLIAADPERAHLIEHATAKRRGMTDTLATREQRAQTREIRGTGISQHERTLADALRGLGWSVRHQVAIGPYNADLVINEVRLVIDVHGGGHNGRQRANLAGRIEYIESQGWRHLTVWARPTINPHWLELAIRKVLHSTGTQSSVPFG